MALQSPIRGLLKLYNVAVLLAYYLLTMNMTSATIASTMSTVVKDESILSPYFFLNNGSVTGVYSPSA
jgi:hypothetical protein